MGNSCRLIDQQEFLDRMDLLINSVSKENDPIPAFKQGLLELKGLYKNVSSDFEDAVKEYLDDEIQIYEISNIDEQIANNIRSAIDSIFEGLQNVPQEDEGSKLDTLSPTSEKSQIRQRFLDNYFRISSFSKLVFLRRFGNNVVRRMFIQGEGDSATLINSVEDLNQSFQEYREYLKDQIKEIISENLGERASERFEYLFNHNLNEAMNYVFNNVFNENKGIFPPSLIARIPEIDTLNENGQRLLNAWQAFVTLKHFDDLLVLSFGKAIAIKNHGEYNLDNSDKYAIKTADKVINTWRDEDEDVDETEELGTLGVLFLKSLKVVDKSGNLKQENLEFSNIKVAIGNLMKTLDVQDGDFFMNNKFSSAKFGAEIISVIQNEYEHLYGRDYLGELLNEFVYGKNFKQLLASAKMYPQLLMPILFRLTQPVYLGETDYNPYSAIFSKHVKTNETLTSLYYQIFSPRTDSIFSMNQRNGLGFDPNNQSIYQYITGIFINIENKQQLEYLKDPENGVKAVNLGTKTNDTRLKALQRGLEGKFNKVNPLGSTNNNITKFTNFEVIDNDTKGITISMEKYNIIVSPDMSITITDKDNKIIQKSDYNYFIPLINEVLDIEFTPGFISVFNSLDGKLDQVVSLVSRMLYNYQVGKHMINLETDEYETTARKYYDVGPKKLLHKIPRISYSSIQPSIISSLDLTTLETISKTKDSIEGYTDSNTVMDGDRKQISTLGLPCMLARFGEIIENYGKRKESSIKHFSIYDMYRGAEYMRDYSDPGNNKQAKKFTEQELITVSFLYDMYGDMYQYGEDGKSLEEKTGGILRVMGPVVSDKSNLIKLKYGWDSLIPSKYISALRPGDSKVTQLRLRDLTNDDIKYIIKQEFGEYYQNVINYVNKQFNILNRIPIGETQNYIDQAIDSLGYTDVPKGIHFDYLSNFENANLNFKDKAYSIFKEAIYLAQENGEKVEFIDQVHYLVNKDGTLSNNKTLIHQYELFNGTSSFETYEQFWNRKENQLFVDFLQSNTELQVKNGTIPKAGIAIAAAIQKNTGWIKGENIAVGKVTYGDKSLLISTKEDFKQWFPYRLLREKYGKELPANLDIDNPYVSLSDIFNELRKENVRSKLFNKIPELVKAKNIVLPNKQDELMELAYQEYKKIRLKYSPNLTEEQIQQGWERKRRKEGFIDSNNKINKSKLKEYIETSRIKEDIDNNASYLEQFKEEPDNFSIEINPEISKHNLYDFYLGEEFVLATTGTYVAHPAKSDDIIQREAEQFGQAVKRYVAYTASIHREEPNALNGIPEELTYAIIEDDTDMSYNFIGESGRDKPFDGATYMNILMNYLDNNSLGADAMGVDKKPFGHYQGVESGIGFIWKTAGFPKSCFPSFGPTARKKPMGTAYAQRKRR